MSSTQTITRTGVGAGPHGAPGAPGAPGVPGAPGAPDGAAAAPAQREPKNEKDYSKRPNAPPKIEEAVPSAQWARWRLYKQRPDIQDNFPEYFPDVRKQLHERLTAQIQEAAEKIPKPPRFTERSLEELKGPPDHPYAPTQLGFAPLTDFYDEADHQNSRLSRRQRLDSDEGGDRIPSLWFERMSQDLFARVWEFCSETFGAEEIEKEKVIEKHDSRDWTLEWLEKLPHEFVVLASQVARGDRTVVKKPKSQDLNNWEFLFLDKMSRVKLMVGVMAKLLEKNVFNSLLFGANDLEKAALTADDEARAFLDNSYQRSRTRSETVRNYIQSNRPPLGIGLTDLFTDNFWDEVESVTMGILDLLLPLINLLGHDMPDSAWPPLKQVHQRLHDIVAEAAWFTNGMRATRSVFWIQFPVPGEMNDISHEHAIDDIWNRSKKMALEYDKVQLKEWETKKNEELAKEHPGEAITEAHRAAYEAKHPRPFIRRAAKVQIAMWPFVKRYTPVRERDAGDGAYNSGETITQIMKAQAVYYYGDHADAADMEERLTLSEQIKRRRWAQWWTFKSVLFYSFLIVLFLLFMTSPKFPRDLDHHSWDIKSSSQSHEFAQGRKTTTTVVGVPVGTEIVRETVIIETADDEDEPSKPQHRSKAPSVSRVTETITATIIRKFGRGQGDESSGADDDGDDYNSDSGSSSYDDGSGDGDDSFSSTAESIAADVASGAVRAGSSMATAGDEAAISILSGMDQAGSTIESATDKAGSTIESVTDNAGSIIKTITDRVGSVIKSVAHKAGSSIESVTDTVGASIAATEDEAATSIASGTDRIASVTDDVAASFASGADRADASVATGADKVAAGIASETDDDIAAHVASGADEAASSIASTKEDIVADSKWKRENSASLGRSKKESRAAKSPDSGSTAAGDSSSAKNKSPSKESTIESSSDTRSLVKESRASAKSSEGNTPIESSTSSESRASEKGSTGSEGSTTSGRSAADESSTFSESDAEAVSIAAGIASEDSDIETTTVYKDEDGTSSVLGVTTSEFVTPPKEEKKMPTTTITVPPGYVVVTVTGPPIPDATEGTVKATFKKIFYHSTRPL